MSVTEAKVVALHVCPAHRAPMQPLTVAQAVADFGLDGDRHAKAGSRRQVLLVEKETLDTLDLAPGMVRENITTQGAHLTGLVPGQRLRLGHDVVLEVTGACTPCHRLDEVRDGLSQEMAERRGVNARVVAGGSIRLGDAIVVLEAHQESVG
jgi:MOSC domain-containing protein YiiM